MITTLSSLRARWAAADPLPAVVALVSLVVYALHGFDGDLSRDLGVYTYGAQRFLDGAPPYVGILNRAGPLAHALPAVGMWGGRLVGIGDIHAARAFYAVIAAACVPLVYTLARELFRSRLVGLVSASAFLGFQYFIWMATNGPREKTPMVLFLLVALLAVRHRRWATAGVFTALGTLTWQPVFFVLVATGLVAVLLLRSGRRTAVLRVAAGGAATSALVVAYYAAHRDMHRFFEGFVLINARYTIQRGADASSTSYVLRAGYGASLWVILLGLAVFPVFAALAARPAWRSREAVPVTLLALGAGWLVGVAWAGFAFNGAPDLFEMLPFAALGIGGMAAAALGWARPRLAPRVITAVALAVTLAFTAFATVTSVTTRSHGLLAQRASVNAVLGHAPPGTSVVSLQAPQVLVLANLRNPTDIQMFTNGFNGYVRDTWPGGLHGYGAWLARTRPGLIATQTSWDPPRWLRPVLARDYRPIGTAPRFRWWASTTIPEDVRKRMHLANMSAKTR